MAQFPNEQSEDGSFDRQEDAFRLWIEKPEANRYHLYLCKACPWAHRTWIVLTLMGLEDVISLSFADPIRDDKGWRFVEGKEHGPDLAEGFKYLSEAYQKSDPEFNGRVTVPVLWDKKEKHIINNSEDDICRILATTFKPLAKHPVDLFPEAIKDAHEALSQQIYETVNNGVYEAGFASSQKAYAAAYHSLFATLDELETRLFNNGPYLFGDTVVEADWRLFCTLIRFDAVYHGHFKCNRRRITEYPALQTYMEKLYALPGIADSVNFDHIKRHYYITHDDINPSLIVPEGPDLPWA